MEILKSCLQIVNCIDEGAAQGMLDFGEESINNKSNINIYKINQKKIID